MNVSEWVCVPAQAVSDCLEYLEEECRFDHHGYCQAHGLQPAEYCFAAKLKKPPTPAPVPVDPSEIEALRRDAACFQWLMSLQSGRPESQIALAQVILAMRKNPEAVRKFIEGQIALAANGEKGT